ncbi:hypothetical protein V8C37DRAFT_393472 [Trichoderma ceciliae]
MILYSFFFLGTATFSFFTSPRATGHIKPAPFNITMGSLEPFRCIACRDKVPKYLRINHNREQMCLCNCQWRAFMPTNSTECMFNRIRRHSFSIRY